MFASSVTVLVYNILWWLVCLAKPKSPILISPIVSINMFSGFKSLWIILYLWVYNIASNICLKWFQINGISAFLYSFDIASLKVCVQNSVYI